MRSRIATTLFSSFNQSCRHGGDLVLVDFLAGKVREVCAAALDSPPEVNNLLTELRTGLSSGLPLPTQPL